ncbi:DUF4167 domain-containing protein [Jannaschia sp. M317]|uniref:DUF4167 domain-containing protein n=1 Tax=Jannaschia sp. M317 TaxID=2867011 RepID=UPI0021A4B9C8|nr:DUF4167 domain-containing protein [Jannaschia sp. M317]
MTRSENGHGPRQNSSGTYPGMRSSKSRSRNKNRNNRPQGGNIVNRVFDSSGPEGKVRGTPQQIIDKYNQLARDAQLSGDRVAVENFQQHAEHYTRMLAAAMKEQEARQQQHNQNQQNNQGGQQGGNQGNGGQSGQNNGGQTSGNQGSGNQNNGGQNNGNQNNGNQPKFDPPAQQPAEAAQSAAEGQPSGGRGNRRRAPRDQQPVAQAGDDVIDVPATDTGPVETPEARADDGEVKAEKPKPKRTRTRKKAPAKAEGDTPDAQPSEEA